MRFITSGVTGGNLEWGGHIDFWRGTQKTLDQSICHMRLATTGAPMSNCGAGAPHSCATVYNSKQIKT